MAAIDIDSPAGAFFTVADVLTHTSEFSAERIRLNPVPGTATECDLVLTNDRKLHGLCELVDGILVEKTMGYYESWLASRIGFLLQRYCEIKPVGIVAGEAGNVRMSGGNVRVPDVSFVSNVRLQQVENIRDPVLSVAPDLAVEVLSPGNTTAEMARKRREYFSSGVRLVWELDPETRVMRVYTAPEEFRDIDEQGTLDGGDVLPGFSLRVGDIFAHVPQPPA